MPAGSLIASAHGDILNTIWNTHTSNQPNPGYRGGIGALTGLAKSRHLYSLDAVAPASYNVKKYRILHSSEARRLVLLTSVVPRLEGNVLRPGASNFVLSAEEAARAAEQWGVPGPQFDPKLLGSFKSIVILSFVCPPQV